MKSEKRDPDEKGKVKNGNMPWLKLKAGEEVGSMIALMICLIFIYCSLSFGGKYILLWKKSSEIENIVRCAVLKAENEGVLNSEETYFFVQRLKETGLEEIAISGYVMPKDSEKVDYDGVRFENICPAAKEGENIFIQASGKIFENEINVRKDGVTCR